MTKKKKEDLATELADLLMEDDSSVDNEPTSLPTSVLPTKDQDPDPTMAISKNASSLPKLDDPSSKTKSIRIDSEKSVATMHIERGVGARKNVSELNDKITEKSPAEMRKEAAKEPTAFGEPSALKEFSDVFKPGAETKARSMKKSTSDLALSAEGALVQSEQLRIAQERILDLENVVDSLRTENEQLVAAGETLKNRSDDLKSQVDQIKISSKEKLEITGEELVVLRTNLASKSDDIGKLKLKIEELESRLQGDLKKIRVRERELENRLEIAKLESGAIMKNKDEIILDLKRKIDQLGFELENYRSKSRELNKLVEDNRERVRRTVKALRLALNMLEGEESEVVPLKKAD
jgi:chromosome segregation ATPase